jgi:hypothetical protein
MCLYIFIPEITILDNKASEDKTELISVNGKLATYKKTPEKSFMFSLMV